MEKISELRNIIETDKMTSEDAAELIAMITRRRKLSAVKDCHKNAILTRKDGRLYTSIGGGKKLISRSGESREDFLVRLYDVLYDEPKPTLDTIWADFFENYKLGRQDGTWRDVSTYYQNHIKGSPLATMPLEAITNGDVDDFFDAISARHVGQHPAKFYAKLRTILNGMFRFASRKRLIRYLPYSADFTDIATRFKQRRPPQTWSLLEYKAILAVIDDTDPYERCFHLHTLLGCRTSEILALRYDDIQTDEQDRPVVLVHAHNAVRLQQCDDGHYHRVFETVEGTKGRRKNGIHTVPLGDEAQRLIALCKEQSTGYLFERPNKAGVPLHPTVYNRHVRMLCERAGVPYYSNYAARRLVVSRLVTSDNHYDLMRVMGWSCDNTAHYATSVSDVMYDRVANLAKQFTD